VVQGLRNPIKKAWTTSHGWPWLSPWQEIVRGTRGQGVGPLKNWGQLSALASRRTDQDRFRLLEHAKSY
jgi:hypothetical protein